MSKSPMNRAAKSLPANVRQALLDVYEALPGRLKHDIDSFTHGVFVGQTPRIEGQFTALYKAYAPLREVLRHTYGSTVTMYRGQPKVAPNVKRRFLSWTTNPTMAAEFAQERDYHVLSAEVDIRDVVFGVTIGESGYYVEYLVLNKPKYQAKGSDVPQMGFAVNLEKKEVERLTRAVEDVGGKVIKVKEYTEDFDPEYPEWPMQHSVTFVLPFGAVVKGFDMDDFGLRPYPQYFGKVASQGFFNEGDFITFGKFQNKPGKIVKLWVDDRGIPMIEIEPVPKGRKKNRIMSLYRIRHLKASTRVAARWLEAVDVAPGTWTLTSPSRFTPEQEGQMWDLYHTAYGQIGMHVQSISRLLSEFEVVWVQDVDGDGVLDAFLGFKRTHAGNKIVLGAWSSSVAKNKVIDKQGELLRKPGWYAELSHGADRLAEAMRIPKITDEQAVREVLHKDITWHGEGVYSRNIQGLGSVRKSLYGHPIVRTTH